MLRPLMLLCLSFAAACSSEPIACHGPPNSLELVQQLARAAQIDVEVHGNGSARGLKRVTEGRADAALCRRKLHDREISRAEQHGVTTDHRLVAYEGVTVHVHPTNPVTALPHRQVRRILGAAPRVSRWSELGTDLGTAVDTITVVVELAGSAGAERIRAMLFDGRPLDPIDLVVCADAAGVLAYCADHPGAIGFTDLEFEPQVTRAIAVVDAAGARIPLRRPIYFCVRPGRAARWVDWMQSPSGQRVLLAHGLTPAGS